MERLALSKDQREKLLKMCYDLFPEYEAELIHIDLSDEFCSFLNISQTTKIHWFELCVLHLPERIADSFDTVYPKEKHALIIDMMMKKALNFSCAEKKHPVDYLYEMYEKTLEKDEK